MTEKNTDAIQVERRKQLVHDIGLGELRPAEVLSRRDILRGQIQIGMQRDGAPTKIDGGLLAIRTGIPPMTPEAWNRVPADAQAFVADIAGTNWNVMTATKEDDGTISLTETSHKPYRGKNREVTFAEFIGRMAYPIAGEVISNGNQDTPVDIGISLGFQHENEKSENGIDAVLVELEEDGKLPKGWKITDWDAEEHRNITQALRKKLDALGIQVRTLVAINDTPAVALDGEAVDAATKEDLDVIAAGFVGGTGTNGAVNKNGLVNLELGRAVWPSDAVFQKMKANGWIAVEEPELEAETGMYLSLRLAAGIQLLHENENSFPIDEQLLKELTPRDPEDPDALPVDDTLISKIASGERSTHAEIQSLAEDVLKRAGQVYGVTLAMIAEAAGGEQEERSDTKAFLVEGGTLLKGYGVKDVAEQTAASLGQSIKIVEAKGLRGIGALAMAYPYLEE